MTIYCDSGRWEYWQSLQKTGPAYAPANEPEIPRHSVRASAGVVDAALSQLAELYEMEIPAPVLATTKAWGSKGVGDGDHLWAVGYDDSVVGPHIQEPMDGLFVTGECFGDEQCWGEGAPRSSTRVAGGVIKRLNK